MLHRVNSRFIIILSFLIFLMFIQQIVAEDSILLEYFYSASCPACKEKTAIIDEIEKEYAGKIIVIKKEISSNLTNRNEWSNYGFSQYGCAVINGEIKIPRDNLTKENLEEILDGLINRYTSNETNNKNITIELPFFGEISEQYAAVLLLLVVILTVGLFVIIAWKRERK